MRATERRAERTADPPIVIRTIGIGVEVSKREPTGFRLDSIPFGPSDWISSITVHHKLGTNAVMSAPNAVDLDHRLSPSMPFITALSM